MEGLAHLPCEIIDPMNQHLKRAMDLSIKHKFLPEDLQVFIVLSCLISVSVNFSAFLVIGKTSPVTYQVSGHLKTCLVLAFGYVLLHDPFSWRNIFGILGALVGMIIYSYICSLENQQKASEASVPLSQVQPAPVFVSNMALIFRWCCTTGPACNN